MICFLRLGRVGARSDALTGGQPLARRPIAGHCWPMTFASHLAPRDPRGLASDAPLLDAWLRFTARAQAGSLNPMAVPGHKQRQDLAGAVVAGDAPLYRGLDSVKHADVPRADAEARAPRLWGADWCRVSVAGPPPRHQA